MYFSVNIIYQYPISVRALSAALFVNPDQLPENDRLAGKRKRKKKERERKKTEVLTKQISQNINTAGTTKNVT